MTTKQIKFYWQEWAKVRRVNPEADRHALHVEALGYDKSALKLDNGEFDRVLATFRAVSRAADIDEQVRLLNGARDRERWALGDVMACLALYCDGAQGAAGYAAEVAGSKFRLEHAATQGVDDLASGWVVLRREGPTGADYLEAKPRELMQLVMTLSARLNVLRNKAGDTIHEMKTKAGVKCKCKACRVRGASTEEAKAMGVAAMEAEREAAEVVGNPF
jgi:hypothetical protein